MLFRSKSLVIAGASALLFFSSCTKNIGVTKGDLDGDDKEINYYVLFTNATKHGLFGNYKTAIRAYNDCIKLFPNRATPYYQLSSIYLKSNQTDNAIAYAQRAVKLDSSNIWYLTHLANIYQYNNQLDSAIFYYSKVVDKGSTDEIKYNLAMLYVEVGKSAEALLILNKLSSENVESKEIMLMKHNVYHRNNNTDSALYWLNKITLKFPNDINSYGMLAEYLTEINEFQQAYEVYRKILSVDSRNGLVLLSFAEHFRSDLKLDSAKVYYKKAFCSSDLKEDDKLNVAVSLLKDSFKNTEFTDSLESWLTCVEHINRKYTYYAILTDILIGKEDFERAKVTIDSALVYKDDDYMIYEQALLVNNYLKLDSEVLRLSTNGLNKFKDKYNLYLVRAYSFKNMGFIDSAIADIDSLLAKQIDSKLKTQAYILLAEIYREKKDYEKSDFYFEEVIILEPYNLVVKNNYAYYLSLRSENLHRAKALSKYVVELEPNNPTYLDTYGWILYKLEDFKEAKVYVEKAIRNGAYENAEVLEHYGDIVLKLSKCNEAIEAYSRVLELEGNNDIKKKIDLVNENCEE